ncbi:amidase [Canariomyces notabilis]|uniref:Amidase n=1 Tax=Canariomyces notabilis TaxID=2074819 RepID=A0AAN6QER9_9PEZI|nr:amidase [Canariomyces arenarius]
MEHTSWESAAAAKRASVLGKIPEAWRLDEGQLAQARAQRDLTDGFIQQFLNEDEISIISRDSVDIVDQIKQGNLTALEVTSAFCKTAALAHQINNCLHEIFFDEALARARELDAHYAAKVETIGPLHGLPISLKDQFHVKGVDTTMGYVGWIGGNLGVDDPSKVHKVESQITAELLSLGAVLFCKTSLPQTLMFGETKNNIIGQTLNPHNQNLSCGGSSGGEGALQALRGSTLGLGTDIGGSVRIPAAFNGIFALKPTPERLSYRDVANTNPGQNTCRSTVGFLSTSLSGLELGLRAVLSTCPWERDPAVVPIPFRQNVYDECRSRARSNGLAYPWPKNKPLKLGILRNDGHVRPHPPVERGLGEVVKALIIAQHQIIHWKPPSHVTARDIHMSFLTADGGADIHSHLQRSGEPLIPDLQEFFQLKEPMPLLEYQDLTVKALEYEAAYSDYWNKTAGWGGLVTGQVVDAVIMPVAPHAAVIPGKYFHVGYTEAINLLNYSAVVIPVTKADKDVDIVRNPSYQPLNEVDQRNWDAYDPETYHGAPVGVQIVTRKFEEEKALAIADIVVSALQSYRSARERAKEE